jgi:hypothetical protein
MALVIASGITIGAVTIVAEAAPPAGNNPLKVTLTQEPLLELPDDSNNNN